MRTAFEEEEDLAPLQAQPDRELTLSSTTLLAIFFGLVLICGLFFGLGYTLGRRAPSESAAEAGSSPAAPSEPSASTSSDYRQKPSPAAQTEAVAPPQQEASEPSSADSPTGPTPGATASSSQPGAPIVKSALPASPQTTAQTKPAALQTVVQPAPGISQPAATPAAIPTAIMVQIAAVSNPADADVLISALHKHGYSVNARHEPADALIHVQVGPFSSRTDAIAMRQKLLGDGYNAILK
jgi:DedD protein